jgi:dTDP-glucose 4,6-dehydratase
MNVRDWIHVRDHSAGVATVLRFGKPGEVYNLGSGNEHNNLEITRVLLNLLGKPESLIRFVTDRLGHDRRYALDCRKIERELGWKAMIPFEQGLRETVQWYLENPEWVAGVRQRERAMLSATPV